MPGRQLSIEYPRGWLARVQLPRTSLLAYYSLPYASAFIGSYNPINYYNASTAAAWGLIGGNVGQWGLDNSYNSCAARLSYALNRAGHVIPSMPEFQTNMNYTNLGGDGYRYIASTTNMVGYLQSAFGTPDFYWTAGSTTVAQVQAMLPPGGAAIGCWPGQGVEFGHCTMVTASYSDPQVGTSGYNGPAGPAAMYILENMGP